MALRAHLFSPFKTSAQLWTLAEKVIHIDFPPYYKSKILEPLFAAWGLNAAVYTSTTAPPPFDANSLSEANRSRTLPPLKYCD